MGARLGRRDCPQTRERSPLGAVTMVPPGGWSLVDNKRNTHLRSAAGLDSSTVPPGVRSLWPEPPCRRAGVVPPQRSRLQTPKTPSRRSGTNDQKKGNVVDDDDPFIVLTNYDQLKNQAESPRLFVPDLEIRGMTYLHSSPKIAGLYLYICTHTQRYDRRPYFSVFLNGTM